MPQAGSRTCVAQSRRWKARLGQGGGRRHLGHGGLHRVPVLAQGLDDGGDHQALHVGAGRVVGAQLVALAGLQGPLQQGAKNGGLHIGPAGFGGLYQQVELRLAYGQGLCFLKQKAVELRYQGAQGGVKTAFVHALP